MPRGPEDSWPGHGHGAQRPGCERRRALLRPPVPGPGSTRRRRGWPCTDLCPAGGEVAAGTLLTRGGQGLWGRGPEAEKGAPSGGIQRAQVRVGHDRAALVSSWETAHKGAKTVETPLLNHSPCILQFTPRSTFTQSCQTAVQKARVEPHPARPPEAARGLQQEGTKAPSTRGEPIPCL